MMDFYMIQMEILLDIRTLVKELIEASSTNTRADETKRRARDSLRMLAGSVALQISSLQWAGRL